MPKSGKSATRMTREQRRAQLIDVALDIFAQHGYAHTTMEEVPLQASVANPGL
ncbi:MAG: TetR/AcrR family transcriptional regulator [Yaniella sp.]|nr:TetR/AcrR family transcriptional regulator [Yaniella sp.]